MQNRLRVLLEQPHTRRALLLATICVLLIGVSGLALLLPRTQQSDAVGLEGLTLPGQQRWMQAGVPVSSYLFGTTDLAQETITPNIETSPGVQAMLKSAGITLIRTDFPDNANDADILARLQTIANAGASCLGTIANPGNVPFDIHLVKLAAPRGCLMWEIGLSPDTSGVSATTYLAQWKALVPELRAATTMMPIKLMGPGTASENHTYIDAFLRGASAANVLPDALSYHWFPCMQLAQVACMQQASSVTQTVQDAQALMQQDLAGMRLPVAITAWNAQLSAAPSTYVSDPAFITPFTATALSSMGQAGVAIANQVAAASGAGGGALDMISVTPRLEPKAQLITLMALILADRPLCGTPVPTMSPTSAPASPSTTPPTGTAVPTFTPNSTTASPSTTPTTTPQASPSVTPTTTVTPCPPCPSPTAGTTTPTPIVTASPSPATSSTPSPMTGTPTAPASPSATTIPSPTASSTPSPVTGTPTPPTCPSAPCSTPTPSASPTGTPLPTMTPTVTVGTGTPTITATPTLTPTASPCPTTTGTTSWAAFARGTGAVARRTGNEEPQ